MYKRQVAVDPALALAGDSPTEADLQALRVRYALDRPLPERYAAYWGVWQLATWVPRS